MLHSENREGVERSEGEGGVHLRSGATTVPWRGRARATTTTQAQGRLQRPPAAQRHEKHGVLQLTPSLPSTANTVQHDKNSETGH